MSQPACGLRRAARRWIEAREKVFDTIGLWAAERAADFAGNTMVTAKPQCATELREALQGVYDETTAGPCPHETLARHAHLVLDRWDRFNRGEDPGAAAKLLDAIGAMSDAVKGAS